MEWNIKHMKKIIVLLLIIISIILILSYSDNKNLNIKENDMIYFERNGGYIFTNDDGGLYWYNAIEDKFYQLNQ